MEHVGAWEKAKIAWSFVEKHALWFSLLFVLVLQFVPNPGGAYPWGGIWMRMQVQDLLIADSASASSVDQYVSQQVSSAVAQQYPNLPEANRQKVVDDMKKKFMGENKDQLENERKRLAQEIRDHYSYDVDGQKFLYMPDIDPYFYLRYARNIVEKGHYYDVLKDGVPWDDHMVAPLGTVADKNWHPHVLAFLYHVGSVFNSKISLMQTSTYFAVVFIFLSLILTFFIASRVSGPIGGFFAVTMLSLLPAVISRTPWGHADTDAYNIFFPVLAVWLLFEALSAKSLKKQFLFGCLTGLAIGIFSNFWTGWWYLFDFIIGAVAIAAVADLVVNFRSLHSFNSVLQHSQFKKFLFIGVSFFITAAIVFSMFVGSFSGFFNTVFFAALQHTAIKEAAHPTLWPNVFTTVAELNPASFDNVVSSVGGTIMAVIAVLGILLLLLKRDETGKFDFTHSALLAIWFVGTTYMSLKGVRFTLLLGPAFAVAFGAGVGLLSIKLADFGQKHLRIHRLIVGVLVFVVVGLIIMNPATAGAHMVRNSYNSIVNDVPLVNDAWWNALTKIKDNSQPGAILNSWWDFGHHFKFISDRAVTFDGSTQNSPQAHWIGRVLQTDNEDEAVAILRMLDCGANSAYDTAFKKFDDPLLAVKFVKNIIMLDKESALQVVRSSGVDEQIIDFTQCDPPEDFFIASGDMIGKAGVWAHFGLWNFERAETWLKWRLMDESSAVPEMAKRFNISDESAKQMYNSANSLGSEESANAWISPWPGYGIQDTSPCSASGDVLKCGGIVVNMSNGYAEIRVGQGVAVAGRIFVYDKNGEKKVFVSDKGNANVAVVLWPAGSGLSAIATYSELADSMFTRMYYMGGLGLRHFRPFTSERQLIGGMIYVYKVDWASTEPYIPAEFVPKDSVVSGAQVSLNYIGWVDEGVFDSSIAGWRENNVSQYASFDDFETKPLSFVVGQGKLIPGFEKGIQGMKPNETKTITIPPEEAYGTDPAKHPLGNKTLNFKIKILSVQ